MRIKRGVAARRRHKKVRALAKGFRGRNRTTIKTARQAVMKAGMHAYRDRRVKKRTFRSLWIVRLNAALRAHGTSYSKFIYEMNQKGIGLNRRALSELVLHDPKGFEAVVSQVLGSTKVAPKTPTGSKFQYEKKAAPAKKEPAKKESTKSAATKKAAPAKKAPAKKPAVKKPAAKK